MPATKKVRSTKRASKKTTKKVVKKVTKKTAKKTTKKTAKKTARKTSKRSKNTIQIKDRTARAKSFNEKLEQLAVKQPSPKHIVKTPRYALPSVSLAILSPYTGRINMDAVAISTARYAGAFFVAIGGFFTLHYAQFIDDSVVAATQINNQVASVICESETECFAVEESYDTDTYAEDVITQPISEESYDVGTTTYSDTYQPPVYFTHNLDEVSISDLVTLSLVVSGAQRVTFHAYDAAIDVYHELGMADEIQEDEWKFVWDTTQYAEGVYMIYAYIENEFGVYDATDERIILQADDQVLDTDDVLTESTSIEIEETEEVPVEPASDTVDTTEETDDQIVLDPVVIESDIEDEQLAEEETDTFVPPEEANEVLDPDIAITLEPDDVYSDFYKVTVTVAAASQVEIFASPALATQEQYLGSAVLKPDNVWSLRFREDNLPTNTYDVYAAVTTEYGTFMSDFKQLIIDRVVATASTTPITTAPALRTVYDLQPDEDPVVAIEELAEQFEEAVSETENLGEDQGAVDSAAVVENDTATVTPTIRAAVVLEEYTEELRTELDRLSVAIRSDDAEAVERIESRIDTFVTNTIADEELEETVKLEIAEQVKEAVAKTEKNVERTNELITQRTGADASRDTDNDGVTDFDEINLFNTDPESADSDGDGFNDGVEILGGFDPSNAEAEAVLQFESPKTAGVVREDVLKVTSVTTATLPEERIKNTPAEALISGKALPNSYVTLYIFSTPVIVTVRTEADGSWVYRFDKELEDGEHEVYVGVTDNAGKIVAKSEPFTFVKEAEAFSPIEVTALATVAPQAPAQNLFSEYLIYLVLSISVVAIGLVLILLGLHLDARPRETEVVPA